MQFRSEAGGVEPNAIRPPDGRKIIYPERRWDGPYCKNSQTAIGAIYGDSCVSSPFSKKKVDENLFPIRRSKALGDRTMTGMVEFPAQTQTLMVPSFWLNAACCGNRIDPISVFRSRMHETRRPELWLLEPETGLRGREARSA